VIAAKRRFTKEHWGALQMLLADPDGREIAIEAPLQAKAPHSKPSARYREFWRRWGPGGVVGGSGDYLLDKRAAGEAKFLRHGICCNSSNATNAT
jgi:hypothetical protein